ncbi:MAG TPA: helix-turn-helix transcriptional regulator [Bacteroidales bacterium]|jgi:transcriptional regulator with XRE-family HTH domain|nr:helix-turn-helix transcriptional regulator [Bacteroidales bacterium]HOL97533.1 helix-turn-helix transcriptional regulator [Bacteroidales bacterium]HOM35801.1 helix-turn-helix transcriptional regulator [Bacteroidales bacterium]HPD22981.1 helix-turn-helix transcriptional regulator [Bacteroidales bacterium]HRS98820.1 helix-turn-helix transcriptional regulator [Bacteroidales bacterium]
MKDRIAKIIKSRGLTSAKFAEEIGVQASGISHILSGRNNPSTDLILKILKRFPDISTDWLLLGEGSMYKNESATEIPGNIKSKLPIQKDLFSTIVADEKENANIKTVNSELTDEVDKQEEKAALSKPEPIIENKTVQQIENNSFEQPKKEQIPFISVNSEATPKISEKPETKIKRVIVLFDDGTFEAYNIK